LPFDPQDSIFTHTAPREELHSAENLIKTSQKYSWINFSRFADHVNRSDIHFFDEETKIIDENLVIDPLTSAVKEQEKEDEMEMKEEAAMDKLFDLLPIQYFVTSGQTVKVTRMGKLRSVWAMMIAGDGCGTATFGYGKAAEMDLALKRAKKDCENNLTFLPMLESRTILYQSEGKFGVCKVAMRPLPRGTGMVAGIIPRLIFECFGILDINANVIGRALPKHQIYACWDALTKQRGLRELSIARGSRSHKMFERGAQAPRTPPREVLMDRALDISRKLREMTRMMTRIPREELANTLREDQEAMKRLTEENEPKPPLDLSDPKNAHMDTDDVADYQGELVDSRKGVEQWGPWAIPPNYVPVLPPMKPYIDPAKPAKRPTAARK